MDPKAFLKKYPAVNKALLKTVKEAKASQMPATDAVKLFADRLLVALPDLKKFTPTDRIRLAENLFIA